MRLAHFCYPQVFCNNCDIDTDITTEALLVWLKMKMKQEVPKGPRSLTWRKGQGSRWSHLHRTTNVVHQIFVEDFKMMLYTKFKSSGPCSFRQDFWKLQFEDLFLTQWPTYPTYQNHLNNFGRRPPRDHSCWVWSHSH